jgi:hypothetical protein
MGIQPLTFRERYFVGLDNMSGSELIVPDHAWLHRARGEGNVTTSISHCGMIKLRDPRCPLKVSF